MHIYTFLEVSQSSCKVDSARFNITMMINFNEAYTSVNFFRQLSLPM